MKRIFKILSLVLGLTACGGGSNSSESTQTDTIKLTKENLAGRWKHTKAKKSETEYISTGKYITQFKIDGTYVSVGQEYAIAGGETSACWSAHSGIFEEKDSILTLTTEKEVGSKHCMGDNFNPRPYTTTLTATTISAKGTSGFESIYEKDTDSTELDYATIAAKFEQVTLKIDDADKPSGFEMTYRSPKQGGREFLCPRLAGDENDGFTVPATFLYVNKVYDTWLQWDEGEITPKNYSGPSPGFEIQKRSPQSSDSIGYAGTGVYICSKYNDCANRCTLNISDYSLTNSSAKLEVSCSNLAASKANDADNLFGAFLSGFKLNILCDYKPDLGL